MRKNAFFVLLFSLICVGHVPAQSGIVLKVNPLSLFLATINVQAEHVLNERFSAQIGTYFGGNVIPLTDDNISQGELKMFGLTPELRYHTNFDERECPRGLYFAPFLRFRRIIQTYEGPISDPEGLATRGNLKMRRTNFGGGVLIGCEFIIGDHFALDLFGGPQFSIGKRKLEISCPTCTGNETAKPTGLDFAGIEIRTGICLGYAF
ncbi:MAG TPA: DUF3575 domain-containing protein [Bacteroidetes bacterium]|nr:DUF3575 domain-containing protein [Bacteroidota bacterium]